MTSSIHRALRTWNRNCNWPYLGSILIRNDNVPMFEETYGQHDYDWILKATEERRCKEIEPCVIRYVSGDNLSLNPLYRERDYAMVLAQLVSDHNTSGIKRLNQSRARYFYKMQDYRAARRYFLKSALTLKNAGYFVSSFIPPMARWIVKKYTVFG